MTIKFYYVVKLALPVVLLTSIILLGISENQVRLHLKDPLSLKHTAGILKVQSKNFN